MSAALRILRRAAAGLGIGGAAAAVGLTLLAATARLWWPGALAAELRWQWGWLALLSAPLALAGRRRWTAALALALAALHLWPALRLSRRAGEDRSGRPELRVATLNLRSGNTEYRAVRDWLLFDAPDVVALEEVDAHWFAELQLMREEYPHALYRPERADDYIPGTFGVALLSKRELRDPRVHHTRTPMATLEASIRLEDERSPACTFHLVLVHTVNPMRPWRLDKRDATLEALPELVSCGELTVLLGDLNATVYSPALDRFLRRTGLRDSRAGFGRQPSWRPFGDVPLASLDLDHVLVGGALAVLDRRIGPDVGSDHRPVIVDLAR